jgi:hypothetical protein
VFSERANAPGLLAGIVTAGRRNGGRFLSSTPVAPLIDRPDTTFRRDTNLHETAVRRVYFGVPMHRIEQYLDNFARVAFLREVDGDLNPPTHSKIVVVARERDPSNRVTRAWFLAIEPHSDGVGVTDIPHRIVASPPVPGEPSKPANPTAQGSGGFGEEVLVKIRQQQEKQARDLQHFTIYCREWHQHLATIAEQGSRIRQLESDLKTADANARDVAARNAILASDLQATTAELEALRQEKSLARRVRELGRRWSTKRG